MKRHRACGMYPFVVRTQWTAVVRSIQSETTTPGQPRRVRVSRGRTQASARPLNTPKPSFDIVRREEGLRPEKVSVVIDVGRRGGRHALINASWSPLFNDWRLIRLQSKLFNYLDPYSTDRRGGLLLIGREWECEFCWHVSVGLWSGLATVFVFSVFHKLCTL